MNLEPIQTALRDLQMDGWLFCDHHHRDPIAYRILGLDEHSFVSRRWFYFIPADPTAQPQKLVHRIESGKLDALPGSKREYSSWQELQRELAAMLEASALQRIAMQYSPLNAIPSVSLVDAGTIELVRSFGKTIVSSADLVSQFEAVLTEAQIATHYAAQQKLDEVLRAGFQRITDATRSNSGHTDEFSMVVFLREAIARTGLFTDHGPNVSCGPNSADSHYDPTPATSRPIRPGDFVLIDIWAKLADAANPTQPDPSAIWYDITWTAVVGREPSAREQHIFSTVRAARDAAIAAVQSAYAANRTIAGFQADDAARNVIRAAGLADFFTHRTGHNIALDLHGNGANLDNLETHDVRLLLPNTCFSVEPGLYFLSGHGGEEAFGIRSEVNMITHPASATKPPVAVVTGPLQTEILRI